MILEDHLTGGAMEYKHMPKKKGAVKKKAAKKKRGSKSKGGV